MHRFDIFVFTKYLTLKPGLGVIQGHWKWCIWYVSRKTDISRITDHISSPPVQEDFSWLLAWHQL